jgi:hypothetical protein
MKTKFYMTPRQVGKSTKTIYEYEKDVDDTLIVMHNEKSIKHHQKKFNSNPKNLISSATFRRFTSGKKFKTIILDEWCFFPNKKEIYEHIKTLNPDNLIIFSTPNRFYDVDVFNYVKECKKNNFTLNMTLDKIMGMFMIYDKLEVEDLYYDFITDPDVDLIKTNFGVIMEDREQFKESMGLSKFELQINGNFFKKTEIVYDI